MVVCRTSDWGLDDTAEDGVVVEAVGSTGVEKLDWDVNMLGHCGTINGCSGCNCWCEVYGGGLATPYTGAGSIGVTFGEL